jgi:hypothetical protein
VGGQIVFPNRREDFDRHGIFPYLSRVDGLAGYTPAVTGFGFMTAAFHDQDYPAGDKVTCLFVGMAVFGQFVPFGKTKLGHESLIAIGYGFETNSGKRFLESLTAFFSKHTGLLLKKLSL